MRGNIQHFTNFLIFKKEEMSGGFNAAPRVRHGWSPGDGGSKPLVRADPESPCSGRQMSGGFKAAPRSTMDEE